MTFAADVLGILFALTSAAVWGGGDFSGGMAARRSSQFHVLALSALSGVLLLILFAAWRGEPLPSAEDTARAASAGAAGALGVAALYRALSIGNAASVAPTAAVVGAALPVVFAAITEGLPGPSRLAGLALAILGIGLVSWAPSQDEAPRDGVALAVWAGVGFAGFFILIGQVETGAVFTPLVVSRCVTFAVALLMLRWRRMPLPSLASNPTALLTGVLDAGGNIFYMLARQFTRLDVAVVLSSLYPVTTVLLARLLLKENVSGVQWAGAATCLAAVVLIAA